jgi:hypothetical protein
MINNTMYIMGVTREIFIRGQKLFYDNIPYTKRYLETKYT